MQPKFQVGDDIWFAKYVNTATTVVCPDCGGTRFVTMEMFDGTRHTLDCKGCKNGYEGSLGFLKTWEHRPTVEPHRITGLSIDGTTVEYRLSGHFIAAEDRVFLTKEEALVRAEEVAAEAAREEAARLQRKIKADKSWAWHVHYHRRAIRQAEKDLAYHARQLAVAQAKAKEPVSA